MARTSAAVSSPGAGAVRRLDLVKLRQKCGLSLERIAENTKISMRFLRAIEEQEFAQLPGGIFNTSYLRQYAAAIGFEEAELLAYYRAKSNDNTDRKPPEPSPGRGGILRWLTDRG